jgi:hypothetical protein
MNRRSRRRKISRYPARAGVIYPRPLNVLEPGRTRRHPLPRLARALWGVAIGFALAFAVAALLVWLR